MDAGRLLAIAVGAILVNNFVLTRFLGVCQVMAVSTELAVAATLGLVATLMMGLASLLCFLIAAHVLAPLELGYLSTVIYVVVIAASAEGARWAFSRLSPGFGARVEGDLRVLAANCAVLGAVLLNGRAQFGLAESVTNGLAGGLGFGAVLLLSAGLRERIEMGAVPEALKGLPIGLVTVGLMALAFSGFWGLASE